jgi:hemin uptake protein HemP
MSTRIPPLSSAHEQDATAARRARRIQSDQLLQGSRRVVIDHGKASYTLLLTRNDKLILVK